MSANVPVVVVTGLPLERSFGIIMLKDGLDVPS